MNVQSIPLGSLATVRSGGGAPQEATEFTATGYPFVRAGSLSKLLDGASEETLERLEPTVAAKHGLKLFPGGTVLFAKSGMSATKGHVYSLRQPAYVVNHLAALVPHDPDDSAFLVRALQRFSPTVLIKDSAYPSIRLGDIQDMTVLAPEDSADRRRIVEVLDRAEALRTKRRAALSQLDALTQSIFLDLFGDPATNPKGWQRVKLGDAVFSASDGPHVSPTYSDDGIPFISTRHVRAGEITWKDLKFISPGDADIHWRKCKPEFGDILYTKGGTTGLAVAVTTNEPFALWVHVALLKPNPTKVDSKWLESMLNTEFCYRQSQELTHGIANRDLGLTRMIKIDMFLPPLTLQHEFARRVAAVKKLKTTHQASLVELDGLFAALQFRAFRGEL